MRRGRPSSPAIPMSKCQIETLSKILNEHKLGQQLVKRIEILLLANKGLSNAEVSRDLKTTVTTVKKWRERWLLNYKELSVLEKDEYFSIKNYRETLLDVVRDLARSGTPKKFSLSQEQSIVSLACDKPENHGIRMTNWSEEMLAKVAQSKGIVDSISRAQVGRILKKSAIETAQVPIAIGRILVVSKNNELVIICSKGSVNL